MGTSLTATVPTTTETGAEPPRAAGPDLASAAAWPFFRTTTMPIRTRSRSAIMVFQGTFRAWRAGAALRGGGVGCFAASFLTSLLSGITDRRRDGCQVSIIEAKERRR